MNYKLLFPTYRTRQRWLLRSLERVNALAEVGRMINVGCGEGDLDRELHTACSHLIACDINEGDVAHARALNGKLARAGYIVGNAQQLPFDDASFDVACCLEVIEHVDDPQACLRELARIVKAGGHVILTCPSAQFPLTYDPINWVLSRRGMHISVGAFGYGHSWLVREKDLVQWAREAALGLVDSACLTKALAGAVEAYWPGLIQRVLKANAANRGAIRQHSVEEKAGYRGVRPTLDEPPMLAITDAIIDADDQLLASSRASVGLAFLFQKGNRG